MAEQELSAILNSGEINTIYLGGTSATDAAIKKSVTDALDTRITSIEASHTALLNAHSTASSQQPTGTDTPLQVEFGALQTTTDIDLAVDGTFTFKTAGKYIVSTFFQYGRTGASGTSILIHRILVNGTQSGNSLSAHIDDANTVVPWASSIQLTVSASDTVTFEIMRDSAGNDSGGLFATTPTVGTWAIAPCAAIQIYKAV